MPCRKELFPHYRQLLQDKDADVRGPACRALSEVCKHLDIEASQAIFVDDRQANVDAARAFGMRGVHMTGCEDLEARLRGHGVDF